MPHQRKFSLHADRTFAAWRILGFSLIPGHHTHTYTYTATATSDTTTHLYSFVPECRASYTVIPAARFIAQEETA